MTHRPVSSRCTGGCSRPTPSQAWRAVWQIVAWYKLRWVIERTFGWMTRWRRLVRGYEQRIDVS
jgi:transposase